MINMEADMKNRGRKALGYALLAAVTFLLVITGYGLYTDSKEVYIQKGIASEIIRFHVRAENDSDEAQAAKMQVKAAVLDYISPQLSSSESIDESRQILENESDNIRTVAMDTLKSLGYDREVKVYFENCYFPMKSYGDITFPPGEYEAFRVDIGEAKGHNWWCVLYPPLCFIDEVYGELPDESKEELKGVLTEEEYKTVSGDNCKIRFKYLTFLNKLVE